MNPSSSIPPPRHPEDLPGAATTVGEIDEDTLVNRLRPLLPTDSRVILGAGDDCAVFAPDDRSRLLLLKTDAVVERLHFAPGEDPERVGWKALCRALSDIAAMGGRPLAALITLGVNRERPVVEVEGWYRGIQRAATRYQTVVVGGETVGSERDAWLSISLLGEVTPEHLMRRDGGRAGDELFVTGWLGGSLAGWHLDFEPRLEQAQWLARQSGVRAMMDLSDGLARDLPRLAAASGCGFEVAPFKLPMRPGIEPATALTDGEDYELLLAVNPRRSRELRKRWAAEFPNLPLSLIGLLLADQQTQNGFECLNGTNAPGGWDHLDRR